ncbi:MAG: DUF3786 domain-containing protein [Desulfobulbaceae bacterium]|nr:DUF3786 domain-containing protein [Desulfobulbaceae bacterium]
MARNEGVVSEFAGNPLKIYKLLPKTNCGLCQLPSCLAFAAEVAAGRKGLGACPELAPELRRALPQASRPREEGEVGQAEFIDKLLRKMASIDFAVVAPQIGATVRDNRLVVNSMGKDFIVDARGEITSECHVISWVRAPLLSYITHPTHAEITGQWLSFREFQGGIEWQPLFRSRCEEPLRLLADANQGLLGDIVDLFKGKTIEWYEADIAIVLHPLPKAPILICYQGAEDDLPSKLTILFDRCCEINLHIKAIFTLSAGLVRMFTAIAERHR